MSRGSRQPGRRRRSVAVSTAALLGVGLLSAGSAPLVRTLRPGVAVLAPLAVADSPPAAAASELSPLDKPLGETRVSADAARRINAEIPRARDVVEPARPFILRGATADDHSRALNCLTQAIYYEAGFEPAAGQRAVAQVVLNRLRHPAFPKSVCGVVYQGSDLATCQFSFTCDGAMSRPPLPAAWRRSQRVAAEALAGRVEPSVGGSTHYHADYVAPYWSPRLAKITQIGAHIFYRWKGAAGDRAAYVGRYAGHEAIVLAAKALATPMTPVAAPERRADNDVGGRVTLGLGWTPSVPDNNADRSAFARAVAAAEGSGAADAPGAPSPSS